MPSDNSNNTATVSFKMLSDVKKFAETTSGHGISRALNSTSILRNVVWSVLFLLSFGFTVYQTILIIEKYLQHPKLIVIDYIFSETLAFPAVTVCNQNPYSEKIIYEEFNITYDHTTSPSQQLPLEYFDDYDYYNADNWANISVCTIYSTRYCGTYLLNIFLAFRHV